MSTDLLEDLSDDSYVLRISDVTLDPSFPKPGSQLRVDLEGELRQKVDLAQVYVQMTVKLGLITLVRRTLSLPDLLASWGGKLSGDLEAPPGPWKQTWTFQLPREIPRGDFRISFDAYTENDDEFAALRAKVDFRNR